MDQLRQGLADPHRGIRGLRLEFGANAVHHTPLKVIKNGVARKQLSAIELSTHPANTPAESAVFRAVGHNPQIKHLAVEGELTEEHRASVMIALTNVQVENVHIMASEKSCMRVLDWQAKIGQPVLILDVPNNARSLRLDMPPLSYTRSEMIAALRKWNAAVVRLAESGSMKSLHLPKEIVKGLTLDTLEVAKAYQMDIFPI